MTPTDCRRALDLLESTSEDLEACGPAAVQLVSRLARTCRHQIPNLDPSSRNTPDAVQLSESLRLLADDKLNSYPFHAVPTCWRRLYTDAVLYGAVAVLLSSPTRNAHGGSEAPPLLLQAIGRLDLAIVIAGTPGPARHELALALISLAQTRLGTETAMIPVTRAADEPRKKRPRTAAARTTPAASRECTSTTSSDSDSESKCPPLLGPDPGPYLDRCVPELDVLPTFLDPAHNALHREPFVVRRGAVHFPAFDRNDQHSDDHEGDLEGNLEGDLEGVGEERRREEPIPSRWSDLEYLRRVAGPGRIVPVEVGGDYTQEGWGQRMMPFDEFLESLRAVDAAVAARAGTDAARPPGDRDRHRARDGLELVGDDWTVTGSESEAKCGSDRRDDPPPPLYYLAQHSLFRQFPTLLSDLLIPDLVYSPPEHHFSSFSVPAPSSGSGPRPNSVQRLGSRPGKEQEGEGAPVRGRAYEGPGTEQGYVLNAWLGPRGTKSAAHTDPWWNCYVQVSGSKWIWVAPPECGSAMRAFGERAVGAGAGAGAGDCPESLDNDDDNDDDNHVRGGGGQDAVEYMTNTSSLDVTVPPPALEHDPTPRPPRTSEGEQQQQQTTRSPPRAGYPRRFVQEVVPHARQTVLHAGDVLVMPPGWWHAMVGLETSFSVSMWF